jgi:hypothetical protein
MSFYRVLIKIGTDSGGEPDAKCDAFLYRKVRCMTEAEARTTALRGIKSDPSLPLFAAASRYVGAFHFSVVHVIQTGWWDWLSWNQSGVILVSRQNAVVSRLEMTITKFCERKKIGRLRGHLADLILTDVKASTK